MQLGVFTIGDVTRVFFKDPAPTENERIKATVAIARKAEELDMDGTIDGTARQGWLDVRMRPERRNTVKVLLFLDVGGSMDAHIRMTQELFSAARAEFRHLEFFYSG